MKIFGIELKKGECLRLAFLSDLTKAGYEYSKGHGLPYIPYESDEAMTESEFSKLIKDWLRSKEIPKWVCPPMNDFKGRSYKEYGDAVAESLEEYINVVVVGSLLSGD